MDNNFLIETNAMTHRFGERAALSNVNLTVKSGEIFALLGPNGAGKTTTIRILNGLYKPCEGSVRVLGVEPITHGSQIRKQTGVLTETNALYERLTARENLVFFGTLYGMEDSELKVRIGEMLKFFNLEGRADDKVGTYSKGMKQRLSLARAMLSRPKILFLDEPTSSLDPESTQQVHELIQSVREQDGHTVFLCTHRLEEAERLADRVAILNTGKVLAQGSLSELIQKYDPGLWVEIGFLYSPSRIFELTSIRGVQKAEQDEQGLRVLISEEDVIPTLIESLLRQQAAIRSVQPRKITLEEIYFQLQENARRGAK